MSSIRARPIATVVAAALAMLAAATAACVGPVVPRAQRPPASRRLFAMRSDFWYDLDHFLYHVARAQRRPPSTDTPALAPLRADTVGYGALPLDERAGWERAVAYYDTARAPHEIDWDSSLVETSYALAGRGASPLAAGLGLPAALVRALDDAAPAYRRLWWPRHDALNRAFAARLDTLLDAHGDTIAARLSRIYHVPWPAAPIVVELTPYASWSGAYTLSDPTLVTLSSIHPGHAGTRALEQIFHEQSHTMMDSIDAELVAAGVPAHGDAIREIEHWIIFYTAGAVVRAEVPGHTTYAEWRGLWALRGFARGHELLVAHWQPYLDGRTSFADALHALARAAADSAVR